MFRRDRSATLVLVLVLFLSFLIPSVQALSQRDVLLTAPPESPPEQVPAAAAEAGLTELEWSSVTAQIASYQAAARGEASALHLEELVKVTATDGVPDDRFGAVDMACDMLLVGAQGDDTQTGSAYLFERNADGADEWGLVKKLVASDRAADDRFGYDVALSCDVAVVGAPGENGSRGATYVFYRNYDPDQADTPSPDNWGEWKKLVLEEGAAEDYFGTAVAIDCDTIAVGVPFLDDEAHDNLGGVYLFSRNYDPDYPDVPNPDFWGVIDLLRIGDDAQEGEQFGLAVDIDCATVVVGARYHNLGDEVDAGTAYVFGLADDSDEPEQWERLATLDAPTWQAGANFGYSVAIACDHIIVGAPYENDDDGAAYLFSRNADTDDPPEADHWGLVASLSPPIGELGARFGYSVALDCDRAVVGERDGGSEDEEGRAYVYERNYDPSAPDTPLLDNWGLVETLLASDGGDDDALGSSVAICGDWVAAGAPYNDMQRGAVYLFDLADCELGEISRSEGEDDNEHYGTSVALGCGLLVVGAPNAEVGDEGDGVAYLFARNQDGADEWGLVTMLTADDPDESRDFGAAVAVDCNTVVVGDPYVSDDDIEGTGAAYVFERNYNPDIPDMPLADNWGLVHVLMDEDGAESDHFGAAVDIACNTIIVGAPEKNAEEADDAGAAFLFGRDVNRDEPDELRPNDWGLITTIWASDYERYDHFGTSVALSCDTAVVGAPDKTVGGTSYRGAAYVFERNSDPDDPDTPSPNHWGERTTLTLDTGAEDDSFGKSVDISCDTIVVGAPGYDWTADNDEGAAFVYLRNFNSTDPSGPIADNWGLRTFLRADDRQGDDQFGRAVAIAGDRLVIGAWLKNVSEHDYAGTAYVFERNYDPDDPSTPGPDYWGQRQQLFASQIDTEAEFGRAVAIDCDWVAVGAPWEDGSRAENGAAYLFGCSLAEPMAALEIDKWHSPEPVTAAWNFSYYIDITNTAEIAATNVVVTDTLPAWVAAYSVQPGQGGSFDGVNTVVWTVASLGPGETMRFSIKARTYSTAVGQCITNQVAALADNAEEVTDSDLACVVAGQISRPTATPTPAPTPTPVGTTVTIKKGGPGNSLDTYIYRNQPYSNYWLEPLLKVGYKQTNATLIEFDLSPLPTGAKVEEAWLEVFATGWSGPGADMVIGAYAISNTVQISQTTWVSPELGLTWALAGANDVTLDRRPLPESTVTTTGPLLWYRFNVKNLTQEWLNGAMANNGVMLRCENCVGRVVFVAPPEESAVGEGLPTNGILKPFMPGNLCPFTFFFASGEYSDPSLGPRLVVRYQ